MVQSLYKAYTVTNLSFNYRSLGGVIPSKRYHEALESCVPGGSNVDDSSDDGWDEEDNDIDY